MICKLERVEFGCDRCKAVMVRDRVKGSGTLPDGWEWFCVHEQYGSWHELLCAECAYWAKRGMPTPKKWGNAHGAV